MVSAVLAGQQRVDLTGPSVRGLQCRMPTWITHSITGNSAISATGISSSHHSPPPTTTRATTEPTRNVAIIDGLGGFQNAGQDWPSVTLVRRPPRHR